MPNKKKKSGQGDGNAPSRLGREGRPGADSPAGADPGTPRGGDGRAGDANDHQREPVPGWSGLGAHAPCDDATRVTLDPKMPVATGIGVHVHALMSQQLMTRANLGAGDWVALAVCEGPEALGDVGSASRGGAPGTPGFAAGGASTPRTPPSPTRQAAQALVGLSIADKPPVAPVAHIPSLLAGNVGLDPDGASPLGGEPPSRGASTGAAAAAAAAATGKVGRFTVLARVHPNPKANPADAVQLARKVWMSLGSPPAGAKMLCYPLNVGITDRPVAAPALCAPIEGAPCAAKATLRLWATEGDAANAAWLERGLGGDDDDDDAIGSKNASGAAGQKAKAGRRQLSVLESLAKRALDGRALLPGNLVRLPLLGVSAYFSVVNTEGHTAVVSTETSVSLRPKSGLADGEDEDDPAALESDDNDGDDDDKDDSSDDGDGTGSRPATPGERMARRASKRKGAAVRFEDLGGVSEFKEALLENVALPLTRPEIFTAFGIKPPRGVLLWGPPGTGKSRLARAAAAAAGANLLVVRGPELIGPVVGESEAALRGVFKEAVRTRPCVVMIDEIDSIAPARRGGDGVTGGAKGGGDEDAMSNRVVTTLLSILDGVSAENLDLHRVVVVATTNRPEAIDRALRRPGRFDKEIEVGVPTPASRREIFAIKLRDVAHELTDADVDELSKGCHGFVGADCAALVNQAAYQALRRRVKEKEAWWWEERAGKFAPFTFKVGEALLKTEEQMREDMIRQDMLSLSWEERMEMSRKFDRSDACKTRTVTTADFEFAKKRVRPSALREVQIEVPKVSWDDVGGNHEVKQLLKEAVEWTEKYPEAMARLGAKPPKGVLLYGPPGCSKTMLARAVASESGRNFLSVKGPELYSKWVGDSEKAVRTLFRRAKTSAPSVIFIDEIDGLVQTRSDGGSGDGGVNVHDRVLTQLLTEMDGIDAAGSKVAVIAATNMPHLIDPALLRPGRFDRLLYIPLPADPKDRTEILRVTTKKMPLAPDVDLDAMGTQLAGYTGADIAALCREAGMAALEEDIDITHIHARHFATSAAKTKASPPTPDWLRDIYERFRRGQTKVPSSLNLEAMTSPRDESDDKGGF